MWKWQHRKPRDGQRKSVSRLPSVITAALNVLNSGANEEPDGCEREKCLIK
jgi:hypothetical protein